jgi:hypothetical protein
MNVTELLAEAQLGIEAEAFLESPLGRHIADRIEREIGEAQTALETVCPLDTEAVRALQNKAKVARLVKDWLLEAIVNGRYAHDELDANR